MSKEIERGELHRTIWKIANDLRGSVDGWDFKSYVLGMLFYRFISENLTAYLNAAEREAGNADFDYVTLTHADAERGRRDVVEEKGFFILPGDLFQNVRAGGPTNPNLNETLARVFTNIEASSIGTPSERDFKGLFDDLDVNSNKLGPTVARRNEKLVKLLDAIGGLPLGGDFGENTNDLFGDAYEYLMGMYASDAGRSGGEYYTPQEVSELLAQITVIGKTEVNKVYDPACGSGALLLKFAKVLGPGKVRSGFYGQEINLTTYNLARINMFLHDVPYEKFDIAHGDTLTDPAHWDDEPFEAIVSNPPYSLDWAGDADVTLINDERYAPAGVLAPRSKADLAFVMHVLHWLAVDGTAAIVEFPGVLYRGGAEQKIREYLVKNNYVDAVIQLPADLFFGTTIGTCIIVLKKSKVNSDIAFVDASAEFLRQGSKNKLTAANQKRILDALSNRVDVDHFIKVIPNDVVQAKDCKLSASAWVEGADLREVVDIVALNTEIAQLVSRQNELRQQVSDVLRELDADALILAADGSSWKLLGELVLNRDSARRPITRAAREAGPIPYYGANGVQDSVAGFLFDGVYLLVGEDGSVTRPDGTPVLNWAEGKIWVNNHAHVLEAKPDGVLLRFLYHYLHTVDISGWVTGGAQPKLNQGNLNKIPVLVPDVARQARLVRQLDTLGALLDDSEIGIKQELALRKRQFDYYRNASFARPSDAAEPAT